MDLPRVQFGFSDFLVVIVKDLEFAHPDIGGISFSRIAKGKPVVTSGWDLEFEADHKVSIDLLGEYSTALPFLALNRTVDDLVVIEWPVLPV